MKILRSIAISIFLAAVAAPVSGDYQKLYSLYGYENIYFCDYVARFPFVHSLIFYLHERSDAFVHGIFNMIAIGQDDMGQLVELAKMEGELQRAWPAMILKYIHHLKKDLYADSWWLNESMP